MIHPSGGIAVARASHPWNPARNGRGRNRRRPAPSVSGRPRLGTSDADLAWPPPATGSRPRHGRRPTRAPSLLSVSPFVARQDDATPADDAPVRARRLWQLPVPGKVSRAGNGRQKLAEASKRRFIYIDREAEKNKTRNRDEKVKGCRSLALGFWIYFYATRFNLCYQQTIERENLHSSQ